MGHRCKLCAHASILALKEAIDTEWVYMWDKFSGYLLLLLGLSAKAERVQDEVRLRLFLDSIGLSDLSAKKILMERLQEIGVEDLRASFEELPIIFSVPNFAVETQTISNHALEEDEVELDIDDINLDDDEEEEEKPKGFNMMFSINKQKLCSKFQSLKGKLKQQINPKQEKAPLKEDPQQEKTGSVDQIKKKYGFSSSTSETTSIASAAQSKLAENLKKLQCISLRITEMQNNAESFSSNAKDLLQAVEKNCL